MKIINFICMPGEQMRQHNFLIKISQSHQILDDDHDHHHHHDDRDGARNVRFHTYTCRG